MPAERMLTKNKVAFSPSWPTNEARPTSTLRVLPPAMAAQYLSSRCSSPSVRRKSPPDLPDDMPRRGTLLPVSRAAFP